jgi:hypothetical protein
VGKVPTLAGGWLGAGVLGNGPGFQSVDPGTGMPTPGIDTAGTSFGLVLAAVRTRGVSR